MSGRPTRESGDAVALVLLTDCTPAQAAAEYGVAVSTVRRALAKIAGYRPAPVGRPRKLAASDAAAKTKET